MPKAQEFIPFPCPYCGVTVEAGDKHAEVITRKNLRGMPTVIVTCILTRTFGLQLKTVEKLMKDV